MFRDINCHRCPEKRQSPKGHGSTAKALITGTGIFRRRCEPSFCETSGVGLQREISDDIVSIRPSTPADITALIGGRDVEFHRFLGEGSFEPRPSACIVVDGKVVGWADYDHDRAWLAADEVNLGYNVFPCARGNGYATSAVRLLMHHLAVDTKWTVASLLIDPDNERSLALARRLSFEPQEDLDGSRYWKQAVSAYTVLGR